MRHGRCNIDGIEQLPDLRRFRNGWSIGLDHWRQRAAQIQGRITVCSTGSASEPEYLSTALFRAMRRLVLTPNFDAPDGCENVSCSKPGNRLRAMNGNSSVSNVQAAFA
jgi:hypothetical protein